MHERNGASPPQPSPTHDDHRDDTGTIVLPRPGITSRVTQRAITQARSTLNTAEQRLRRARGNRAWRLARSIEAAHATLRAAGGTTA